MRSIARAAVFVAVLTAVVATPAAAVVRTSAAGLRLVYVDKASDRVGSGSVAKPDGRADGHFRVTVTATDRVTAITLRTADAAGKPCCGQVWNTVPRDQWWILGVFRGGRQLNAVDENISDPVGGSATYDVYGADTGYFRQGQRFVVTVEFRSGSCVEALTTVGGGSTAGRACAAAPAAPPSGSATGIVLVNGAAFTSGTIPYGSTVDVTNGRLTLRADVGTLLVYGDGTHPALFRLRRTSERVKGRKRPLVQRTLVGGDFSVCGARSLSAARAKGKPKVVRALWGKGKGRFRTQGRYASATVRGTFWLTADRCDGTLVLVRQGTVAVRDFTRRRTVSVRAGRSYVAPARR
jgi:hypothetical protein